MTSAIVKVDTRSYRKIAQENWGLTKEQMKGMHVHHRLPQSRGGTNDSSNLYVCSLWFHLNVWHGEGSALYCWGGFMAAASGPRSKEWRRKIGDANRGKKLPPRTKEENLKRSKTLTGRKAPQPPATCPHCDKTGRPGAMALHHFDNCKHKVH